MTHDRNLIPPQSLIISCQAPVDSPLHDPIIIAAMAKAAINQGAVGVRVDTPDQIKAVRERITQPIIGLWKQQIPGCEVYITPRFADAIAIAEAGADIIAIDATVRNRPDAETINTLIPKIQQELGKQVMADVDTLEAAIEAAKAGADFVGTTLYGYTKATASSTPPGLELLKDLVKKLEVPVICEGGISSPQQAKKAIELGAYAVVVGTAITGIDILVNNYQTAVMEVKYSDKK